MTGEAVRTPLIGRARSWIPGEGREHRGALAARSLGTGPPVVLLHGLVGSSRYWGGAYDVLGARHHLVVPDLLGFGASPKPRLEYTPDDHVDALIAVLDEIGTTEPAVIGAHSAGSIVALRLAARHPARVRALVAFGPPLYASPADARARLAAMGPMARLFTLPGPLAERACAWVCDHRDMAARLAALTHPHLPREVAVDSVRHTWASYTGTLQNVVLAADGADDLAALDVPVVLVAGDADPVVDLAHVRGLRGAKDVRVWRGGHHLPLWAGRRCARLISDVAGTA